MIKRYNDTGNRNAANRHNKALVNNVLQRSFPYLNLIP